MCGGGEEDGEALSDDGTSVHQGRQVRCGHLIAVRWSARGQLTATREPQESPVLYAGPPVVLIHLDSFTLQAGFWRYRRVQGIVVGFGSTVTATDLSSLFHSAARMSSTVLPEGPERWPPR